MAQRHRKKKNNGQDQENARKKPRPRKARGNGTKSAAPLGPSGAPARDDNDSVSGPSTPSMPSTPSASQAVEAGAPLPGEFYQRAGRWWWRAKLPGEARAKTRSLKPPGAKAATTDRQVADQIAFAMWQHAVEESAARQAKQEGTEKVERLKAQFLDKVRHFTELVETANAKIEAETAARAEAEAKLAQVLQPAQPPQDQLPQAESVTARVEEPPEDRGTPPPAPAAQQAPESIPAPSVPPPPEPPAAGASEASAGPSPAAQMRQEEIREAGDHLPPLPPAEPPQEGDLTRNGSRPETPPAPAPPSRESEEPPTGVCECCGAAGIARPCLTRIDSGQSLCPRCLAALRTDIARLESAGTTD